MNLIQVIYKYRKLTMHETRATADKWLKEKVTNADIVAEVQKCVSDNGYLMSVDKQVMDIDYV